MTIRKRGGQEKPHEEKVVQFCIYTKRKHITQLGRDNAREIAEKAILKAIEKIK